MTDAIPTAAAPEANDPATALVTMYDSASPWDIPAGAPAVAGYGDGIYVWKAASWARFPGVPHKVIAVKPSDDGDVLDDVLSVDPAVEVVLEESLEVPELCEESLEVPELCEVPVDSGDCAGSVVCAGSVTSLGSGVCAGSGVSLGGGGTTTPVADGVNVVPPPVDPPVPPPVPPPVDPPVDPVDPVDVLGARSTPASESRRCALGSAVARSEASSAERRWRRTATSETIAERSFEDSAPWWAPCSAPWWAPWSAPWRADSASSAATRAGEETGRPAS